MNLRDYQIKCAKLESELDDQNEMMKLIVEVLENLDHYTMATEDVENIESIIEVLKYATGCADISKQHNGIRHIVQEYLM